MSICILPAESTRPTRCHGNVAQGRAGHLTQYDVFEYGAHSNRNQIRLASGQQAPMNASATTPLAPRGPRRTSYIAVGKLAELPYPAQCRITAGRTGRDNHPDHQRPAADGHAASDEEHIQLPEHRRKASSICSSWCMIRPPRGAGADRAEQFADPTHRAWPSWCPATVYWPTPAMHDWLDEPGTP